MKENTVVKYLKLSKNVQLALLAFQSLYEVES